MANKYSTLISTNDVITYLRIDAVECDSSVITEIENMINSAVSMLQDYTGHYIQAEEKSFIFNQSGEARVYAYPINSVTAPADPNDYTSTLKSLYTNYCAFDADCASDTLDAIMRCLFDIRSWMIRNKLKINDDKTEFLVISSRRASSRTDFSINIGDAVIKPSSSCRNLGVIFDNNLMLDKHISNVCRSTLFHLRNIGLIRAFITQSAAEQLVHSLVTSRLDYCNSLLYGLPDSLLNRLQRVQNVAARIIMRRKKSCHITPVLQHLHWLPVKARIIFKILLLTFRSQHGSAPAYLSDLVRPYKQSRSLRSSSQMLLSFPNTKLKMYGQRSFMYAAAYEWNSLPLEIKQSENVDVFKSKLKTHLFKMHYSQT